MTASAKLIDLAPAECRQLLTDHSLGRIAFVVAGDPMILPVNYVFVEDRIAFRTDEGEKLMAIPMSRVAFEIDGHDGGSAWSVVARGHAREVTTALGAMYEGLRSSLVPLEAPGAKLHWIAIEISELTGRAIR